MYLLLEEEINKKEAFQLTEEHFEISEKEREKHFSGKSKSYTWDQAKEIIRGKKS